MVWPYKTKCRLNLGYNSGSIILNVNIFFEFFLYVLLTNIIVFRNANYSFTSAPDVGPKYTEIEEARNSVCVCVHVCVCIFICNCLMSCPNSNVKNVNYHNTFYKCSKAIHWTIPLSAWYNLRWLNKTQF